uniref:Uncharacterized protein n=1 Tax=Avena sativa TaxID=4498 RepID=A0ACD5TA97_AVESA
MNPENGGEEETSRRPKLQARRKASTEEGSWTNGSALPVPPPAGPVYVYAPAPLRAAWTVNLGNGHHGTMVHSISDNSLALLHPEARSAVPIPWMPIPMSMPFLAPAPAPAPAPQHEYEDHGLLLIKLLHSCAAALAEGEMELLNKGLEAISGLASEDGEEPMQRLGSSFADALALRMFQLQPWQWGVCRAPQLQHRVTFPAAQEVATARRHFAAMCPFLRISGSVANHAIVDAMGVQPDMFVHVIDLGGANLDQWLQLLRLFAERSLHQLLRLTVVNEQEEFLSEAAELLATEAERLGVGFLFHPVRLHIDQLFSVGALGVRSGEALAVVSTLQLHRLLADDFAEVAASPPPHDRKGMKVQAHGGAQQRTMTRADALLRDLRKLSPKLVVVTEQEANHNGADFGERFRNALGYYGALFDALEESVPARGSAEERAGVERCLLREEIRDIVARDGTLRRERHETVQRWAARMDAAGFAPEAVRQGVVTQAAMLAQELLPGGAYTVSRVNNGCFFIYRHANPMFSVSTWRAV